MAIQGKYGWYVCDYSTFRMIKRLKKEFFISLRQDAKWNRWNNKQPQNRVLKKYIRDSKGHRIGVEILGPAPEPKLSKIFLLDDMGVLEAYNITRLPYKSCDEVPKIPSLIEKMIKIYKEIDNVS